jgi:hypothetical protein
MLLIISLQTLNTLSMKTKCTFILIFFLFVTIARSQTNTILGTNAGNAGSENTSIGYSANDVVTGTYNVSVGSYAGFVLTSGIRNTFIGRATGRSATTASYNTFLGNNAGYFNTTGSSNTFLGSSAGLNHTTGSNNVFVGVNSGLSLTTSSSNTAIGSQALYLSTTGSYNTAIGMEAMYNTLSGGNTGTGYQALYSNTTGYDNTALGYGALVFNTTGFGNTALGYRATMSPGIGDVQNSTALGAEATITASNQVRIGNADVTSIGGVVGWSIVSDGRFKKDIKEDVSGLNFINGLRPVSYTLDVMALNKFNGLPDSLTQASAASRKTSARATGFVAQEVEALVKKSGYVFGGVDAPQNDKDHYGIRYDQFVVPLVKAVQELSAKVEEQQSQIEALLSQVNTGNVKPGVSEKSVLYQNIANPFSSETEIRMVVAESVANAQLIIYNLEGTQLKSIEVKGRGEQSVKLSGSELKAGIYLYAFIADGKIVDTKRMVLMK